ncbi:MAG: hypothetical protein IE916_00660 [Epsilonproteobacteria bacterium]|nr:hypothetical protein [Campylobacterota bacterium]
MEIGNDLYPVTRILAPKFYINVDKHNALGNIILMVVDAFKTKEEGRRSLGEENSIVAERGESDISLNVFNDGMFVKVITPTEMIKGKVLVAMKPLLSNIWELEKERQTEIVSQVKRGMLSAFEFNGEFPMSNIVEMDIMLSRYAKEENNKSLFVPISSDVLIKNTTIKRK